MTESSPQHNTLLTDAQIEIVRGAQPNLDPHFTFVVENTTAWFQEARNLVLSIRKGEHPHTGAAVSVHFASSVRPEFQSELEDLGAKVKVSDPFDPRSTPCNKLNILDFQLEKDEFLVLIDADTIVVGEISQPKSVSAALEYYNQLAPEEWKGLCRETGVPFPESRTRMTAGGKATLPYWNTGLVTISSEARTGLAKEWKILARKTADWLQIHKPEATWFTDQISFALLVFANNHTLVTLPSSAFRDTNSPIRVHLGGDPPQVIHYGTDIRPDGFLYRSNQHPDLNLLIDGFNRTRASAIGQAYQGLSGKPLSDRVIRRIAKTSWYRSRTIRRLRASATLSDVRNLWKSFQQERRSS